MITHEHCPLMARYNEWMNSRLYALCANLLAAELCAARGAFFKSIYLTLNHISYGDLASMSRFTGVPAVVPEPGLIISVGDLAVMVGLMIERLRDDRLVSHDVVTNLRSVAGAS